jgi:putative transposase
MPNYVHMVMVPSSEDELWSSASAHLAGNNDILVTVKPMLDRINNWQQYLSSSNSCNSDNELVAQHTRTGRPLGSDSFVKELESICGKSLAPQKPGALCSLVIGKY